MCKTQTWKYISGSCPGKIDGMSEPLVCSPGDPGYVAPPPAPTPVYVPPPPPPAPAPACSTSACHSAHATLNADFAQTGIWNSTLAKNANIACGWVAPCSI